MSSAISKKINSTLIVLYLCLVLLGIYSIFSVQYRDTDSLINASILKKEYIKQFIWLLISLVIGLVILFSDSKIFSTFANILYGLGLFLLIIVLFVGGSKHGSHSWINLGFFAFQPGEIHKLFTTLALSRLLSTKEFNINLLKHKFLAAALIVVPALLIILENETGLALVYFTFFLVLYREGFPLSILIVGIGLVVLMILTLVVPGNSLLIIFTVIALIFIYYLKKQIKRNKTILIGIVGIWFLCVGFSKFAVPFAFRHMKIHQVERVFGTLGKDIPKEFSPIGETIHQNHNESEYNVKQSKIAIASGGLLGKGPLRGTQTRGAYVPEQSTDFIICTIGEELGMWGMLLVISLYGLFLYHIIQLAERQRSNFSRVYAYSFGSILFFHIAINLSMTVGLAPVIGIPLPFLSYGGTSLLSFSIMFFIMLRLDLDKHVSIR